VVAGERDRAYERIDEWIAHRPNRFVPGHRWISRVVLAVALAAGAAHGLRADDLDTAAQTVATSQSESDRVAAVTVLARAADKRALKPLVAALHDPSAKVRAIAAAGLGKLGHRASLPALEDAEKDPDPVVQKHAHTAAVQVRVANGMPAEEGDAPAATTDDTAAPEHASRHAGKPTIYVVVKSASDDSPGKSDERTRKANAGVLRDTLLGSVRGEAKVTTTAAEATKYGLDACEIDLSITKLEQHTSGDYIEVQAELRLAISDTHGRMKSFLSNGAKIQVPRKSFDQRYLPQLRREALENATRGLTDDLLTHLRRTAGT
jgi:HEAT repeats